VIINESGTVNISGGTLGYSGTAGVYSCNNTAGKLNISGSPTFNNSMATAGTVSLSGSRQMEGYIAYDPGNLSVAAAGLSGSNQYTISFRADADAVAGAVAVVNGKDYLDRFTLYSWMPADLVLAVGAGANENDLVLQTVSGIHAVETGRAPSLQVYPNPTSGQLRIENYEAAMGAIGVYDVIGRVVHTANVETGHATSLQSDATIDISHLPAGVYFVRIGNSTAKVVKE
jgi:hypothetical protein